MDQFETTDTSLGTSSIDEQAKDFREEITRLRNSVEQERSDWKEAISLLQKKVDHLSDVSNKTVVPRPHESDDFAPIIPQ